MDEVLRSQVSREGLGGFSRRRFIASLLGGVAAVAFPSAFGRLGLAEAADDDAISAAFPRPTFPIKVRRGRRFLVDAAGRPFLVRGDAPWGLIAGLKLRAVDRYLEDRQARGFNSLVVRLIDNRYAPNAPNNAYGTPPFLTPGDFSTPNPEYFRHAARVIRRAARKGFLVLLAPAYVGTPGGDGWYAEMVASGPAKLRQYGRYLGRRFRKFRNILWVHSGDRNPPDKDVVRAVAEGIREIDQWSLHTAHCQFEVPPLDFWAGESWLTLNNVYSYEPIYLSALSQYNRPEEMPFILLESVYENEHGSDEKRLRTQAYHALLRGATGEVFGDNPIWHFDSKGLFPAPVTWRRALRGRGSKSMEHLHKLFARLDWWRLVPDVDNNFLIGGLGSGHDRAVAARARNRSFAVIYLPTVRNITVRLRKLRGPNVAARWYDPSNGRFHKVGGSPLPARGRRKFHPRTNNAFGFSDWVLVLTSVE